MLPDRKQRHIYKRVTPKYLHGICGEIQTNFGLTEPYVTCVKCLENAPSERY